MSVLGLFSKFNHNKLSNGLEIDFYLWNFTNQTKNVLTVNFSNEALAVVPQSPLRVTLRGNNITLSTIDNSLIENIRIYASDGRLAYTQQPNLKTILINVKHWSRGIYVAVIQVDGSFISKKFIIN